MSNLTATAVRELDRRTGDRIDVQLLWNPQTDRVSIAVEDGRSGERFELAVNPTEALTAFHHPYAYAGYVTARPQPQRAHHFSQR
jgi:hypothetical protein